jgi:fatty acid desaturase
MPRRTRIVAFGSAALLAVVGVLCGVLIHGLAGQILAIALISFGVGGALLLVFYEVGLSEDHERERDERARRRRRRSAPPPHAPRPGGRRRS